MNVRMEDVGRIVQELGGAGRRFQSSQVRKHLHIPPTDRPATARVHNLLRSLERDKVIEVVPGARKRNRFYRLVSALSDGVAVATGGSQRATSGATPATGAADRLTRMEQLLASLDERLVGLEAKVDRLLDVWR